MDGMTSRERIPEGMMTARGSLDMEPETRLFDAYAQLTDDQRAFERARLVLDRLDEHDRGILLDVAARLARYPGYGLDGALMLCRMGRRETRRAFMGKAA